MNKIFCLFSSPIDTFSGYGNRSRDLALALLDLKKDEWDIRFLSLPWGHCPWGALDKEKSKYKEITDRIIFPEQITTQPDVYISISVSNEFQPIGKVNIGVSALVETDILPAPMLEGLNRMTFNIVSSYHSKKIAEFSTFDRIDKNTNQSLGKLKLEKPIHVLFEGVDTTVYDNKKSIIPILNEIEESYCFLCCAHWLQGDFGEDRKNLGLLIKTFLLTFKGRKNKPALILKTSGATYSYMDRERILYNIDSIRNAIKSDDLPNIYLIHGELTEDEMQSLYKSDKVKTYIQIGSEGFGRPALEFSACSNKPIIASPWSGHVDFLDKDFNIFVGGELKQIHPSAVNPFLIAESKWFKPDPIELSSALNDVHENYSKYLENAKRQGYKSRTNFSLEKMKEQLKEILDNNMPVISKQVSLKLPKLADIKK